MTVDFLRQSLGELAELVRVGKVSAREVTGHALGRIARLDPELNAFVCVDAEGAMAAARRVDDRVAAGEDPGPLAGVPVGVKDLEDAAGLRTTRGSAIHESAPPAVHDSVLVGRLRAAGAVVVGKTNTSELGWKADTVNRLFGATRNPWNHAVSPGGSSGGSAAAVAAGLVPLATGSDGGGSIRIPAAACGLPGFKPSLGRIPTGGGEPEQWHNLSTRGVMARTVIDTVTALDAVLGPDPTDLRSLPMPEPSWLAAVQEPHLPMKVGWSPTLGYAEVDEAVAAVCRAAVERMADLGAEVVEIETVFGEDPGRAWSTIANAYHARALAPYVGTEVWGRVDPGLRTVVERGLATTAVELVAAEDQCHRLNLRLVEVFHDVRLLVTPTTAATPPPSGGRGRVNGREVGDWVALTQPFNMTRSPAGSVCAGFTPEGLPVGLQLVGPQHGDLVVLRAMAAIDAVIAPRRLPPVA